MYETENFEGSDLGYIPPIQKISLEKSKKNKTFKDTNNNKLSRVDFVNTDYWGIGLNVLPEIAEDGDDRLDKLSSYDGQNSKIQLKKIPANPINTSEKEFPTTNILRRSINNKDKISQQSKVKNTISFDKSLSGKTYSSSGRNSVPLILVAKKNGNGVCSSMLDFNLGSDLRGIFNEKAFLSKILPGDCNV